MPKRRDKIKITKIFNPQKGNSKYTKTFCEKNIGKYPVYSATNNKPLSYRDGYDYDGEYITISVNGIAGIITIKNEKFSITGDRMILIKKNENDKIDLRYIKYILQPILRNNVKGRKGHNGENEFTKMPSTIFKTIEIPMPIDENGNYDIEEQSRIADCFETIENNKNKLLNKVKELSEMIPTVEYNNYVEKKFIDIADIVGKSLSLGQVGLNEYKNENGVPVYTAASDIVCRIKYKEDKIIRATENNPVLTIATNGDGSAGRNLIWHTEDFFIDSGRGIIKPKNNIDLGFLKYCLRNVKKEYGFNRAKQFNKKNASNISVYIPIINNEFDIDMQKVIAQKYFRIEEIKSKIINKVYDLVEIEPMMDT